MGVRLVSVILMGLLGAAPAFAADTGSPAKTKAASPAAAKRGDPAAAECAWLGKRIIQLLSRDDVVAAGEFRQFYVSFGCSEAHLGAAFGCAIEGSAPGAADACSARSECVDLCWASPTASPLDKSAPTPAPAGAKPAAPAQGKPQVAPPQPPKKPADKPAADKPADAADKALLPRGPYDKK